jgi:hypothetical protein
MGCGSGLSVSISSPSRPVAQVADDLGIGKEAQPGIRARA